MSGPLEWMSPTQLCCHGPPVLPEVQPPSPKGEERCCGDVGRHGENLEKSVEINVYELVDEEDDDDDGEIHVVVAKV